MESVEGLRHSRDGMHCCVDLGSPNPSVNLVCSNLRTVAFPMDTENIVWGRKVRCKFNRPAACVISCVPVDLVICSYLTWTGSGIGVLIGQLDQKIQRNKKFHSPGKFGFKGAKTPKGTISNSVIPRMNFELSSVNPKERI
jgi:hypothetical protein